MLTGGMVAIMRGIYAKGEMNMSQEDLEMLTVEEVAEMMKVNIRTVRLWVQSGELPRVRIGTREYRISKADLRAFIEKRKRADPFDSGIQ